MLLDTHSLYLCTVRLTPDFNLEKLLYVHKNIRLLTLGNPVNAVSTEKLPDGSSLISAKYESGKRIL